MDRLEAMAAFVAVVECRGFASAARKLRLSPSAVTRLVASLEEHLSISLLRRTTRSVSLTDGGARYLERARRILAAVEEAEASAQSERVEPAGTFVVAASSNFGRRHVVPLLVEFLERYPKVAGELTLSDRNVNLIDEGIDLALRIGALQDSSLVAKKVGTTRRVLVASPSYLSKHKRPSVPADLRSHAIVHFTGVRAAREWVFTVDGREERVEFSPVFATNSTEAAIHHVELGGGITRVLGYQVLEAVQEGRLEVLLKRFEPPPSPIHVVYPSSRLLSANVRAFTELIQTTRDWRFVDF